MNKRDTYVAIALLIVTIGLFYGIFYFKNHYLEERGKLETSIKTEKENVTNLNTKLTQQGAIKSENDQLRAHWLSLPNHDNYTVPPYTDLMGMEIDGNNLRTDTKKEDWLPYPVPEYTDDGEIFWMYYTSILYRDNRPYSRNLEIKYEEPIVNDRGEAIIPTEVKLTVKEADYFNMLDDIYKMEILHRTIEFESAYAGIGPDPAAVNSDDVDIESYVPLIDVTINTEFFCAYRYPDPNREYPYSITVEAPIDGMYERSTRGN